MRMCFCLLKDLKLFHQVCFFLSVECLKLLKTTVLVVLMDHNKAFWFFIISASPELNHGVLVKEAGAYVQPDS